MKFGRLSIDEAEGAILAHAVKAGEFGLLKKGTVLSLQHVEALKNAKTETVLAAKLEDGDVGEDSAAGKIASAVAGDNCHMKPPFTGRSNLVADLAGVVTINKELLNKINTVDPSITIATLKHYERAEQNQMVATIKIIPFATDQDHLDTVIGFTELASTPLISVSPFKKKKIGVISTRLEQTSDKLIQKSERILANRLNDCGNEIDYRTTVSHHETPLSDMIAQLKADRCDLILIFGASAITDTRDVVPSAIELAGGTIEHFGMPVDPGNLLLIGSIEETTVIGLPGCTRSPKLNGFDWVLERLLADIPVTANDIMGMGEGGLLKEISSRPQPRELETPISETQNMKIGAILLAAGQSRRMGANNKLLALVNGKPMVRHAAETLLATSFDEVLMVTGHEAEQVVKAVWDLNIPSVQNPNYAEGLSTSLKLGFELLHEKVDAIMVCLGDMPFVAEENLIKLIDAFDPVNGKSIIVPTRNGKRGNPVLISSQYWPEIKEVTGDMGAKALISSNDHAVEAVEIDSAEIFVDIDTPESLAAIDKNGGQP